MKPDIALSVVVPLYNEKDSLAALYASLVKACDQLQDSYELIFVDDGSRDETFCHLTRLHAANPCVKAIRFRRNYGQTLAMAAGFAYAKGAIIVSMDGDLQNDPADIPRLLSKLGEGYDVVCGWRRKRQDKFLTRRLPSIVANWLIGRVTGVRIRDNGCSLKVFRAPVIKNVRLYGELHRFIPAMSTLAGARIAEIPVNHHPRRFGRSKYGLGRIWRVMLDIITVKMITGFASRPAAWFGLLSFPFILLGLGTFIFSSALHLNGLIEEWLVLSTVAFLFLTLSTHLLTMGILGELSMKTGDYRPKDKLSPTLIR